MSLYLVHGGKPLKGEVDISGAKNAALGIIAASIMTDETVVIHNVPMVSDIKAMLNAIASIGAFVEQSKDDPHTYTINGSRINNMIVETEQIKKIRASYYLIGALLGKYNEAQVPLPGGCDLGTRGIDQHEKGFSALGARVGISNGFISVKADRLYGTHIYFDKVSVGATINVMLAAVLAEGKTVIESAAKEPHVVDIANFLNSMGANIRGAGTDNIRITGVPKLHASEYTIIPDQIEAGTFMMAAAITGGDILVKNIVPKHMDCVTGKLREMNCRVEEYDDSIRVIAGDYIRHTNVQTHPYPGFPTDMQPLITVTLGLADGMSLVTETVFDNRFRYVDEIRNMGAKMSVTGTTININSVPNYTPANVNACDFKAGAALVIAALSAKSPRELEDSPIFDVPMCSIIEQAELVERGYEYFDEKLRALGGYIYRFENREDIAKFNIKQFA